jgi:threonylcarbamoyladenosine tRNA methylthiotransferase MtaB
MPSGPASHMATFSIQNFGCRATEADAAALRHLLLGNGLTLADEHSSADIVVLNTCTVTAEADSQAREAVRKIHRANPAARVVVTGCYAQRAPEELASLEGVCWVIGNSHQADIPAVVRELVWAAAQAPRATAAAARDFVPVTLLSDPHPSAIALPSGPANILTGDILAQRTVQVASATLVAGDRTRPILKIQDGCNHRCSYCVIPLVRGRSRSLPPDLVIEQARRLVAAGVKEIVLSGINLGSYGRDLEPRVALLRLVERILAETEIEQLRFSSIEPQDITEDLVSIAARSTRLATHFHVPLQSGSDRVLRAMHRWYRAEQYAERIGRIRRLLPNAAIGADVLVGFPAEADEDFEATAEFIERLPFTYLHVFRFSERPRTEAANLSSAVPWPVIRERARSLRALAERKSAAFRALQAGSSLRALTLARGGENWTEGLTGNYLKVRIRGRWPANRWHQVRLADDPGTLVDPL